MPITKLELKPRTTEETEEEWQERLRESRRLESLGCDDPNFVPLFAEFEIEDEVTMEQAAVIHAASRTGVVFNRHRYRGIPFGAATPAEARQAREADIDDMDHKDWNDGED